LPLGLREGTDGVMYIPSLYDSSLISKMEVVALQAYQSQEAVLVPFLPMAPRLAFSQGISASQEYFEPVLTGKNGVLWVEKLGFSPIYYLRSLPKTSSFNIMISSDWLKFLASLDTASSHLKNSGGWEDLSEDVKKNIKDYDMRLDENSLNMENFQVSLEPRSGYYLSSSLWENFFLTIPEIELKYEGKQSGKYKVWENFVKSSSFQKAPFKSILGSFLGIFSLLMIWRFSPKFLLFLIFIPYGHLKAQKEESLESLLSLFKVMPSKNANIPFRISICQKNRDPQIVENYKKYVKIMNDRTSIILPTEPLFGACEVGKSEIWWTSSWENLDMKQLQIHIRNMGFVVIEGQKNKEIPLFLQQLEIQEPKIVWENINSRHLIQRSFYLLPQFDNCPQSMSKTLSLLQPQAHIPLILWTSNSYFWRKPDCWEGNQDYRTRSFVNSIYAILNFDYKEDQMQLPELMEKIINLGLEP